MSKITTHVLDTALGKPAAGVHIALEQQKSSGFKEIGRGITNSDGRCAELSACHARSSAARPASP